MILLQAGHDADHFGLCLLDARTAPQTAQHARVVLAAKLRGPDVLDRGPQLGAAGI